MKKMLFTLTVLASAFCAMTFTACGDKAAEQPAKEEAGKPEAENKDGEQAKSKANRPSPPKASRPRPKASRSNLSPQLFESAPQPGAGSKGPRFRLARSRGFLSPFYLMPRGDNN